MHGDLDRTRRVTATATLTTIAVAVDTLLVDEDTNEPDRLGRLLPGALTAGARYGVLGPGEDPDLPQTYLTAHTNVVWFTGQLLPGPDHAVRDGAGVFLDGGGRLFMSGQDILDQAAGTTAFVHDYLHIDWDGSEVQNDKATATVHGVAGNPVTDGHRRGADRPLASSGRLRGPGHPDRPRDAAFTDDTGATDALTVADGYKVLFLAFPFEAYGTAADKSDLMRAGC